MAKGILIAAMDFAAAEADEFHDWYDLEHLRERLLVPGFLNAERWIGLDRGTISLATYDLTAIEVLESSAYLAVAGENASPWTKRIGRLCPLLIRYEGEQTNPGENTAPPEAEGLLLVAMNIDPEYEIEFNEWYDREHIPALSAVPGALAARRYRGRGATQRYVALYHFLSPETPSSRAWKEAAGTSWTDRLRPHFRDLLRIECRRYRRSA